MKNIFLALSVFGFGFTLFAGESAPWSTTLSFDGGGVWTKRVSAIFENRSAEPLEGKGVSVLLGKAFQGVPGREIRVTTETGQEVLFDLHSDGSVLTIPVDCESGASTKYFIYFGNPKAEIVPEFLDAPPGFVNGDMEKGTGTMPDGWSANADKAGYRNFWTNEKPKSGKKCVKTVIEPGNPAEWFAVRQSNISVLGGAKYKISAWVRGEDVKGRAGWFIHVGNGKNSQMINNVQGNHEGTFDWKEIVFEFTAPEDADRLTVGTVLYGTGTAWFDAVSLEVLDAEKFENPVKIEIDSVESIPYKIVEAESDWPKVEGNDYLCRSTFRIVNDSDKPLADTPVLMTLRGTQAHGLPGPLTDLYVMDGGKKIPARLLDADDNRVVATLDVPARTLKYLSVYYRFDESKAPKGLKPAKAETDRNLEAETAHPELQATVDPFAGMPNLVKNGDFENEASEDGFPMAWNRNDRSNSDGVKYSLESDPKTVRFGKRCAKLEISEKAPQSWRGWTQRVEVEAGKSYLVQGWIKTAVGASARIHLHFHDAKGSHTKDGAMTSIGPDVSGDWKRLAEVVTTPAEARFMTIHLTTNDSGIFWHDNISVFDGLFAEQVDRESFSRIPGTIPYVWQIPAATKVFPQTISPREPSPCPRIEAARNEKEPLQLAFRSEIPYSVQLSVHPPRHQSGFVLDQFEINTVGYVAVDYPSNYYNTKVPKWYRKTPTSAPGCDGWKGLWPDPLLPESRIDLKPNQTESAWITWSIPKDAPPGKYLGSVGFSATDPQTGRGHVVPVEITVRDFTLPDETHVTAMYDVRFGPGAKHWSKPLREYYKEIVELMSENRLAPDTVGVEPKVEFKDGKFSFDWTEYDKACEWFFNERKIRLSYAPMNLFYIFGWGHPPKKFFGENPYEGEWPFTGADFTKLRPEYKTKYQTCLRAFWEHVKEKGWADRFVLYICDEPNYWQGTHILDQMKVVCEMIHEVDPKIPIYSSTWKHLPEWDRSLDVWGIGHYGIVPVETMEHIKKIGSKIWFTTDGMLCLDTPYNAIERLLPYYCYKYGADAYEFWGVAWLTWDPYKRGDHAYIYQSSTPGEYGWVRYPNGDGYMIYPPHPAAPGKIVESVRFAQAREGVEDFEYFYLLTSRIETAKKAGKDVSKAEAALEAVKEMVDCPSPIGRYSSKILPNPNRIYEVRRQVAEAIEMLKRSGD